MSGICHLTSVLNVDVGELKNLQGWAMQSSHLVCQQYNNGRFALPIPELIKMTGVKALREVGAGRDGDAEGGSGRGGGERERERKREKNGRGTSSLGGWSHFLRLQHGKPTCGRRGSLNR
jgi:hypothetical protein